MAIYHCYEISTTRHYVSGAFETEAELEANFRRLRRFIPMANIDTYAVGTVAAENVDDALERVWRGDWAFTQKI